MRSPRARDFSFDYNDLFRRRACDYIQPDVSHAGGIMELKKIGDKPGLGIELNEEECLKHPYTEHHLHHYTGALTDIRPAKTEFYF